MGIARMLLYFLGALLVLAGLVMLFFETGLSAWVPTGIALAGLVILIGLLVLGLSDRSDVDRHERVEEHHHHDDHRH